jgi:cytidyltransferase-like protein
MAGIKKIMVFGTFDFLHIGHLSLLKQAKSLGDYLVVCLARDTIVKKIKGKPPIHDEQERKQLVESLALVDEVIFGDTALSTYDVLRRVKPSVVAVGYDQAVFEKDLKSFLKKKQLDIHIKRIGAYKPGKRKSSMIKKALNIYI